MEGSRGEHKHGGSALWLPEAFTSKTERALCSEWSVSLFALWCVAFFFPAKPLGWEWAVNKGCISFICSDRLWLYLRSMRQRIITFWRGSTWLGVRVSCPEDGAISREKPSLFDPWLKTQPFTSGNSLVSRILDNHSRSRAWLLKEQALTFSVTEFEGTDPPRTEQWFFKCDGEGSRPVAS